MVNTDTGYLYGQLNNYVEYLTPEFSSTDGTITVSLLDNNSNKLDLSVNTTNLITLKQVKKDIDPSDDPIKYYSLYAYNNSTKQFDIKIGQEIVVDTSLSDNVDSFIQSVSIKVGEKETYVDRIDEDGNIVLDEQGNPVQDLVIVPIYAITNASVTESGQLRLDKIPFSGLTDKYIDVETGKETQIEALLDGNVDGEVY